MNNEYDVSRRKFIKSSVMTGGAILLSGMLPVKAATQPLVAAKNIGEGICHHLSWVQDYAIIFNYASL